MSQNIMIFLCLILLSRWGVNGQQCLSSPNELAWSENSNGSYSGSIDFDVNVLDSSETGWPCSLTTRSHNGYVPSQTIRMIPGKTYYLTVRNNLGKENDNNALAEHNTKRNANTSNIHTHGLHISPNAPADSIFTILEPGNVTTYIYNMPCNHFSGTHWWHPHSHGSVTLHMRGGASGALIVEQESNEAFELIEGIPSWLYEMDELIMVLQRWILNDHTLKAYCNTSLGILDNLGSFCEPKDNSSSCQAVGYDFNTINGVYNPTICLTAGSWLRMRIVAAAPNEVFHLFLVDDSGRDLNDLCQLYLVAKDGILMTQDSPRLISHVWMVQGGRADVLINCVASSSVAIDTYSISIYNYTMNDSSINSASIASIQVTGNATEVEFDLSGDEMNIASSAFRADYAPDLRDVNDSELTVWNTTGTRRLPVKVNFNSINNVQFEDTPVDFTYINSINEWNLTENQHPLHAHIFPFQMIESLFNTSDSDITDLVPDNWHLDGDYYDVWMGKGIMRFITDTFGGKLTYHCHLIEHEDIGAMALIEVVGGCDWQYNDYITDFNNTAIDTYTNSGDYSCVKPVCPVINTTTSTSTTTTSTTPNATTTTTTTPPNLGCKIEFDCDNNPCSFEENQYCNVYQSGQGCSQCQEGYWQRDVNSLCMQCQETFGNDCQHCADIHGCQQCKNPTQRVYDDICKVWYCQ